MSNENMQTILKVNLLVQEFSKMLFLDLDLNTAFPTTSMSKFGLEIFPAENKLELVEYVTLRNFLYSKIISRNKVITVLPYLISCNAEDL